MNEQQKEIAARRLCELRGIDPDASVAHGANPNDDGSVPYILVYSPAWRLAVCEIEQRLMMDDCIAAAQGDECQ